MNIKVFIDADGCPVTDIALILCSQYHIPCLLLCDTAHQFHHEGVQTLVFDKGADSVDFALVNRVQPGDLVITQDYGLASMCLARNCRVIHQDGWEYTADNMDALLLVRHESHRRRAAGGRIKGPRKRTHQQDLAFQSEFEAILQNIVQG